MSEFSLHRIAAGTTHLATGTTNDRSQSLLSTTQLRATSGTTVDGIPISKDFLETGTKSQTGTKSKQPPAPATGGPPTPSTGVKRKATTSSANGGMHRSATGGGTLHAFFTAPPVPTHRTQGAASSDPPPMEEVDRSSAVVEGQRPANVHASWDFFYSRATP